MSQADPPRHNPPRSAAFAAAMIASGRQVDDLRQYLPEPDHQSIYFQAELNPGLLTLAWAELESEDAPAHGDRIDSITLATASGSRLTFYERRRALSMHRAAKRLFKTIPRHWRRLADLRAGEAQQFVQLLGAGMAGIAARGVKGKRLQAFLRLLGGIEQKTALDVRQRLREMKVQESLVEAWRELVMDLSSQQRRGKLCPQLGRRMLATDLASLPDDAANFLVSHSKSTLPGTLGGVTHLPPGAAPDRELCRQLVRVVLELQQEGNNI